VAFGQEWGHTCSYGNRLDADYQGVAGNADKGDGNVTKLTQHENASTTRVTTFIYDWRNRRTDTDGEIDFYQIDTWDNLDRLIKTEQKDTTSSGNLIARTETKFDNRGRVYQTVRYEVNPSNGQVGTSLTDNSWFDATGNLIKQKLAGSSALQKMAYDGLGRPTKRYVSYDTAETSYADASTVTGDTVLQQAEVSYDAASTVIQQLTRARFHDATGTGELNSPGTEPKARVGYLCFWPDAVGRPKNTADYGTNGGSTLSRPSTAPARSDTVLVTTTDYNDRGEAYQSTDPFTLYLYRFPSSQL
jgi:hypothetical protein